MTVCSSEGRAKALFVFNRLRRKVDFSHFHLFIGVSHLWMGLYAAIRVCLENYNQYTVFDCHNHPLKCCINLVDI